MTDTDNQALSQLDDTPYLCGACHTPVTWEDDGVCCDSCSLWFHTHCQGIGDNTYKILANSSITWCCTLCNSGIMSSGSDSSILDCSFPTCPSPTPEDNFKPSKHSSPKFTRPKPCFKHRPLRLININAQSMVRKKGPILQIIEATKPDILMITETWLTPDVKSAEFFDTSCFTVFRKDRITDTAGGGVLLAINSSIPSKRILTEDPSEAVWAEITLQKEGKLILGCCYRPKTHHDGSIEQLDSTLNTLAKKQNVKIMFGGDFNLPGWDWEKDSLKPDCPHKKYHTDFRNLLQDHGLSQLVDKPTRKHNTLDLMVTNRPTWTQRVDVIPGVADHDIVYLEMSTSAKRLRPPKRQIMMYHKADWERFSTELKQSCSNLKGNVEQRWTAFENAVHQGIKRHIPSKASPSRIVKPWVSNTLQKKIRLRNKQHIIAKKSGTEEDERKFKAMKYAVQRDLRRAYNKYVGNLVTPKSKTANTKAFWNYIKAMNKDSAGIQSLKVGGTDETDSKHIAELLNNQFVSVFSTPSRSGRWRTQRNKNGVPSMPEIKISTEGVKKCLSGLNVNKAPGPDKINNWVYRSMADTIAPMLTNIYQHSIDTSAIPSNWRKANVTPIYKKGSRQDPANYRPISLTCIACKVLEHIIVSCVMKHWTRHNILNRNQHGFQNGRSCDTQLLGLVSDLSENLDNAEQTDLLILDFAKAFDKVDHHILGKRLYASGVRGSTHSWIEQFLTGRTQSVVLNGFTSSSRSVTSGVPQGSVLGPSLFLIFINGMTERISEGTTIRLYADDTILYRKIHSSEDTKQLNHDLKQLEAWEGDARMEFNAGKCEKITVSRKRRPLTGQYTLHEHTLNEVQQTKYLGVTITSDLRWNSHINSIVNKANSRLGFLRRNLQVRQQRMKSMAYKSLVRPLLEYASAIWSPAAEGLKHQVEMVQRRAARFVTSTYNPRASVTEILHHLQWKTLESRRNLATLTLFTKGVNGQVDIEIDKRLIRSARITRGNTVKFVAPQCNTITHTKSFWSRAVALWNALGH